MSLTPRDRVLAQIHHQETDHIPYTLRFDGDVAEHLDAYYGSDAWRGLIDDAIRRLVLHWRSIRPATDTARICMAARGRWITGPFTWSNRR